MGTMDFCHNCFSELTENKCRKCGYMNNEVESASAIPPGTLLNHKYKTGRVLGIGGFGITYKALNVNTKQIVAVKEYFPGEIAYRGDNNTSVCIKTRKRKPLFDEGLHSFINEANFLVLLNKYRNIVDIYDCFNENNTAYYAMEFLDGYTLKEIGSSNFDLVYDSIVKVANALKQIHSEGIVHRDISPQNIFILKNSEIKLIDFGNARYFNKKNDNDDKLVLKPGFSPPELYMKENVQGPWTDIYSLAATFYTTVTNIKLPDALSRINGTSIVPIENLVPDIKPGLSFAINKALELDYVQRQKNIDEFFNEINTSFYIEKPSTEQDNKTVARRSTGNSPTISFKRKTEKKKVPDNAGHKETNKNNRKKTNSALGYVVSYDGSMYPISDIKDIVIGRNSNTSHIVISDVNISRKHCVVEYNSANGEFYITDYSVNGTFNENNERLEYGVKYKLAENHKFYVYSHQYTFKVVIKNDNSPG